jgi:hypothetical protein
MANRSVHPRACLLLLLLFFWAAALCTSIRAEAYGEVSVNVESVLGSSASRFGNFRYGEYRILIVNRSTSRSHRVSVSLFHDVYMANPLRSRREIEVAPGSSVAVPIFSYSPQAGNQATVEIDGVEQRDPAVIDASRTSSWSVRSSPRYSMMISREIEKSGLMSSAPVEEGFKVPGVADHDVAYLNYQSPASEWSPYWISYSGFEGVALTAGEMRAAPESSRAALLRYAETGGAVIVAGQWEVPGPWRARTALLDASFVEFNPSEYELRAAAAVATPVPVPHPGEPVVKAELKLPAQNDVRVYYVGFGSLIVTGATPLDQVTNDQWRLIKSIIHATHPEQKSYHNLAALIRDFPVIDRLGVPVRGLFALMMAFVVLVGPINFFWLARPGKKLRILWTIPIISLLTCLAVAGYALLGEGVAATARTESLTVLDENNRRATTLGWTAIYSPITPGQGVHFSLDAELLPQDFDYSMGSGRIIDFSNDQHLVAGWVSARIPAFFKFRKNEARRERLTIRPSGGLSSERATAAVNGLGVPIRRLWYADRTGKIFTAEEIAPGAQAGLDESLLQASGAPTAIHEFDNHPDWLERMKWIEQNPAQFMTPGTYLAVVDQSPFVEGGLDNITDRKGRSLILGLLAERTIE